MEQVLSRGMWVKTGSHIVSPGSTKASFTIQSKTEMAPSARLLVYCINQSGEIVVDSLNIEVENPFQNEVRTFFSLVFIIIFICFSFPISSPSSSLSSPSFFSPLYFHLLLCIFRLLFFSLISFFSLSISIYTFVLFFVSISRFL